MGTWLGRLLGRGDHGPARLRQAFETLGPTYVKLGQLVASSEGMFPDAYCVEFRKCLDRVPPFDAAEVDATLRSELKREPSDVFESFDYEPLASASIAQVHAAVLKDGTSVVVKVQRPKLSEIVAADLRVLKVFAAIMERLPRGDQANPRAIVEDFEANLAEELDFRREAKNLDEFNAIMAQYSFTGVAAPRPHHELSSPKVLVMERFHGNRIDDAANLERLGEQQVETKLLEGMRAWFRCLLVHGFFHGDVHAGNLMTLNDGRVGFLDFGIVGRFTGDRRNLVSEFLLSIAMRNFRGLAHAMVTMGEIKGIDEAALATDMEKGCAPLLDPSRPAKYADFLPIMLRVTMRHRMRMPRDFVLILKQMIYFDRYAKLLAPKLNIFADPRIIAALMEDLALSRSVATSPAPTKQAPPPPMAQLQTT
jgi:predicted unusual protein kinase regulating ubiquinone biosynthesis (AarF/ABC1/UbiB family)